MRQSSAPRRVDPPTVLVAPLHERLRVFPGLIDEVPIYAIAVSEDQVQKHFNGGAR
jgi:hypothetical protein